jgi:hypothetical protein
MITMLVPLMVDDDGGCTHTAIDCNDYNACTTDTCITETGCHYEVYECEYIDACNPVSCDSLYG